MRIRLAVGETVKLTFHGGGAPRLWLDMGQSFSYGEDFFVDPFLGPRSRFGLRDHFALDLMPKIPGLYSQDALPPTHFAWRPPEFSGIAISHIHFDHVNQLQFADPDIPVFLGEGTQIMLDSWMICV